MAFNTKVDVADTELEENEAVVAEAEDVTLEDEALADLFQRCDREDRCHGHPRGSARSGHEG